MTKDTTYIADLNALREKLVETRRARAHYARTSDPENAADLVIELQVKIEAIDRAIVDEKKLAPADGSGVEFI